MKKQSSDVWDNYWQHSVPTEFTNFTPQIIRTISAHLELKKCRILEVGAGTGGDSIFLGNMGATVVALDFSEHATRNIANKVIKNDCIDGHVLPVQGDAWHLPFHTESFDVVFHQGVLEHFKQPELLLEEQRRVLRKGGFILVDVPQRYTLYTPYKKYHIWRGTWDAGGWETEFSYRQLLTLLNKCGFQPVDSYGRLFFPYLISGRNQLKRIERLFFRQSGFPSVVWRWYDNFWRKLESSILGLNLLMSIGIIAKKV